MLSNKTSTTRNTLDETFNQSSSVSVKKSGFAGSFAGIPLPIGAGSRDATTSASNTAVASSIASQNGGVLLQGDGAVLLQGVKVDAAKDITIQGGIVSMAAATDYTSSSSEHYTRGTKASDGGFDVNVKGHTDLKGGVISSTQAAIDGKKNSFQTASLTTSDIENHSTYKASGCSVSGSVSGALG